MDDERVRKEADERKRLSDEKTADDARQAAAKQAQDIQKVKMAELAEQQKAADDARQKAYEASVAAEAKREADVKTLVAGYRSTIIYQAGSVQQLKSINQKSYERDPAYNIYHGGLMCGIFAAYNGECMFKEVHEAHHPQGLARMCNPTAFNEWLHARGTIVRNLPYVGDLHALEISRLLAASHNHVLPAYVNIVELTNIQNSFMEVVRGGIRSTVFLPVDDELVERINGYRMTHEPQLIILNTGGHWIAILLTDNEIYVADSLEGIDRTTSHGVAMIRYLFNEQPLLSIPEMQALRAMYRDAPRTSP